MFNKWIANKMKRLLKTVRHLVNKLVRGLGYLILIMATLMILIHAYEWFKNEAAKKTYMKHIQSLKSQRLHSKELSMATEKVDSFIQGLAGHEDYLTHKGLKIPIGCFSNTWWSGDNYEHYYETYSGNEASWEDDSFRYFVDNIGDFMGSIVPINDPIFPGWGDEDWGDEKMINLSPRIDQCEQYMANDHRHTLVVTPINLCNDYAPHLDKTCLGTVLGVHYPGVRGSEYMVYGLYGIYQGYEEVEVIVPIRMYTNRSIDGTAQLLVDAGWKVE